MRKVAFSLVLMQLSIAIELQVLKLYLEYQQLNTRLAKLSRTNDEMQMIMNGYQIDPLTTVKSIKYRPQTWTNKIAKIMQKRKLSIHNRIERVVIQNKTIMDWAIEYVKQKQYNNTIIAIINSVRLYQKILLPYELVGM